MSNGEANIKQPHQYYVDLVKRVPKIKPNKLTRSEKKNGVSQFGNNFHFLFLEIQISQESPEKLESLSYGKLAKAENTYGDRWRNFLSINEKLVKKIVETLDHVNVALELREHYAELLKSARESKDYTLADEFESLGIQAVQDYAWKNLNPLLEDAAKKMRKSGIKPENFF